MCPDPQYVRLLVCWLVTGSCRQRPDRRAATGNRPLAGQSGSSPVGPRRARSAPPNRQARNSCRCQSVRRRRSSASGRRGLGHICAETSGRLSACQKQISTNRGPTGTSPPPQYTHGILCCRPVPQCLLRSGCCKCRMRQFRTHPCFQATGISPAQAVRFR